MKGWNEFLKILLLSWSLFVFWQYGLRVVLPALLG